MQCESGSTLPEMGGNKYATAFLNCFHCAPTYCDRCLLVWQTSLALAKVDWVTKDSIGNAESRTSSKGQPNTLSAKANINA